jgi:hypothetical protein
MERVLRTRWEMKSASLREEKHRVEDNAIHLLPDDPAAFVLLSVTVSRERRISTPDLRQLAISGPGFGMLI